jgi:hypothetical protein
MYIHSHAIQTPATLLRLLERFIQICIRICMETLLRVPPFMTLFSSQSILTPLSQALRLNIQQTTRPFRLHIRLAQHTPRHVSAMEKKLLNDVQGVVAGAATSTLLYGCNLILAASCIRLFYRLRKKEDSKRRQGALLIYILGMVALATQAVVHTNHALVRVVQLIASNPEVDSQLAFLAYLLPPHLFTLVIPSTLPIVIWGADGILVSLFMRMIVSPIVLNSRRRSGDVLFFIRELNIEKGSDYTHC